MGGGTYRIQIRHRCITGACCKIIALHSPRREMIVRLLRAVVAIQTYCGPPSGGQCRQTFRRETVAVRSATSERNIPCEMRTPAPSTLKRGETTVVRNSVFIETRSTRVVGRYTQERYVSRIGFQLIAEENKKKKSSKYLKNVINSIKL